MKKTSLLMMLAIGIMVIQCGCGSKDMARTGFLSDYSQLQKESDSCLRYVNEEAVARYSGFIVDPVQVRFYSGSKSEGKLTKQQITDLTSYMHTKIVEAVQGAGKKVAYQPSAGIARIRVALTDMEKSSAVSILPQASLLGAGIGGASMEAEVVDSMTGKQIGAVVESKQGSRMPFANLGDWTAAKNVIDSWAKRFQNRLENAQ
ncbi:MAG: DUF3313 domain-containing protein [Sedimentisphaerales bacterium]|nr:DUF3313 domain-containing protein [Sedimentisphaerales bacterium]